MKEILKRAREVLTLAAREGYTAKHLYLPMDGRPGHGVSVRDGEQLVATTVLHLGEVDNILSAWCRVPGDNQPRFAMLAAVTLDEANAIAHEMRMLTHYWYPGDETEADARETVIFGSPPLEGDDKEAAK